jgi:hypothetical protein
MGLTKKRRVARLDSKGRFELGRGGLGGVERAREVVHGGRVGEAAEEDSRGQV